MSSSNHHGLTNSAPAASTVRVVARGLARASLLGCLLSAVALGGCSSDDGTSWPKLAVIPLTNPDGAFWGPMLTVGNQSFLVHLDTGSSTTAIAGANCASCASVGVSPLYMPSSTAKDQNLTAKSFYADMSGWTGEIYTDNVSLGQGTPSLSMAITNISDNLMQFFFEANGYQGILGMGAPALALPHTGTYFNLAEQSGAVPAMAFELCTDDGTMWLGGFDATKAASAPVYTTLLPISPAQPFYSLDVSSMSLGSTKVASATDFRTSAGSPIFDTGTTRFYTSQAAVTTTLATVNALPSFKTLFGGKQLGTLEADNHGCITQAGVTAAMVDAMLPALTFTFPSTVTGAADVSVSVPATDSYILDVGDNQWCLGIDANPDGTTILGDWFLRGFVSILDLENQQVGFAPDVGCASSSRRRSMRHTTLRPEPLRVRPSHG